MTKSEYGKAQASLVKYQTACVNAAAKETQEAILRMAYRAFTTGDAGRNEAADDFSAIYEKYRNMAADKASALAEQYLEDILKESGLKRIYKTAGVGSPSGDWYELPNGRRAYVTEGRRIKFLEQYETAQPVSIRHIHERAAEAAEERIFDVIEGGRELGRSRQEIAEDLQIFVKYKDGGERVVARWKALVSPYGSDGTRNERKVREGWEREYILRIVNEGKTPDSKDWIAYPSLEADVILREPSAEAWIRQESAGASGDMLLPPTHGVAFRRNMAISAAALTGQKAPLVTIKNAFSDDDATYKRKKRKAWQDRAEELTGEKVGYEEIRVIRTESAIKFNERQRDIAEDSAISTGKVTRRLSDRRDAWKCKCVDAAEWINADGGKTPAEIPDEYAAPLHPNCDCADMPIMKSPEEINKGIFEEYFGEEAMKNPPPKYVPPDDGILYNPTSKTEIPNPVGRKDNPSRRGIPEPKTKVTLKPDHISYRDWGGVEFENPFSKVVKREPDYAFFTTVKEANKKELEALGEMSKKSGNEFMSIMTAEKTVPITLEGAKDRVEISQETKALLKNSPPNSLTLNHVHTNDSGFSVKDLWVLNSYKSIKEFRLGNAAGKKFSASVGDGIRISSEKEFKIIADKIEKDLLSLPVYVRLKEIQEGKREPTSIDERLFTSFIAERNGKIKDALKWAAIKIVENSAQKENNDEYRSVL